MIFKKIFLIIFLVNGLYFLGFSQIQYKIELLNGKNLYQVSLLSNQNFAYPSNIIGTAQVSIKAPLQGFQLGEINSLLRDIEWQQNAIIKSPMEAKDFQYISFGLTTTGVPFPLQKSLEVPLFTFRNIAEDCPGAITLINSQSDAFLPPNSRNANIGNQITPFACSALRNKNAYSGNLSNGVADCALSTSIENINDQLALGLSLSPNPAHNWLKVLVESSNLKEPVQLQIWETGGKLVHKRELTFPLTNHYELSVDITSFASGHYTLVLIQGTNFLSENFVKAE